MIDIDEYKRVIEVRSILERKIKGNRILIDEKNKSINDSFNSFYNAKSSSNRDTNEVQMLQSIAYDKSINNIAYRQLNRYLMMINKPYFGRIDFKNEDIEFPYYFGIESIVEANDVVINDWRSPVANLYYEGVEGKGSYDSPGGKVEGEITLKRQYKFENGALKYYVDMGMNISDEMLIDILGKNNNVVMKNIVSSIQKEQNQAIRYIGDNDLLVLGVAGSGKTSIALHRIAYLAYKDSVKYDAKKICLITPNEIFFKYIDNVLPELGEENVINLTMNEVARTILKIDLYKNKLRMENKIDYIEKIINGKKEFNCDEIFLKLNEFLQEKMVSLFNDKLGLKVAGLTFKSEIFKELYFNKFNRRDYYERKKFIKEFIKDRVSNHKKLTKNTNEIIDVFIDKLLPDVNYFHVYDEFLNSINYEGDVIHRRIIGYEHLFALCYVKIFFKKCKLFEKFNHLLIDEYQDLNVIERSVIQRVFFCSKTFVGDFNQSLFLQDYEPIYNEFKVVELNSSYRSTIEIFEFLQKIIKSKGINGVNRHGEDVKTLLFDNITREKEYLLKVIDSYNGNSMAIVCKNKKSASKLYLELCDLDNVSLLDIKGKEIKRGIVVGSVSLVKGLEFDKVIVYEANDSSYNNEIDRNYFYIACSRAINSLEIISSGNFTRFLGEENEKNIK